MSPRADAERGRIAPARIAAYDVLRAVNTGHADLPHALARVRANLPDERDRALAGEIATGTLRWQGAFDRIVSEIARREIHRFDPEVLDVLRTGIFQLLHLDRVPASAAVSDAVSLTRKVGKASAAPLVNAVLRRVSRERSRLPLPRRPESAADRDAALDYLSVTLSHPRWLVSRWLERYGFDNTDAWLRFNNTPPHLTLRVNRLRTTPEELTAALEAHEVRARPGRFSREALVVEHGNPILTPLADEGVFFIQDEASQIVAHLVEAKEGERVLDACASPGGKTTAIAAAMGDRGLIVATDVRGRRVDVLARTVRASGAESVRIIQADVSAPLPFRESFDWVLLDAPCSGLGTLRRDPDLKWRRNEADLPRLAEKQRAMLVETARVLRPGGRIVYSTCSSEPDENEDVVSAVAAAGALELAGPSHLPAAMQPLVNAAGHLRTLPFAHGLEAFFAAVLVKKA